MTNNANSILSKYGKCVTNNAKRTVNTMAHHDYYITLEKKLNRAERCKKRGKLHDENRAKARERERSNKKVKIAAAFTREE